MICHCHIFYLKISPKMHHTRSKKILILLPYCIISQKVNNQSFCCLYNTNRSVNYNSFSSLNQMLPARKDKNFFLTIFAVHNINIFGLFHFRSILTESSTKVYCLVLLTFIATNFKWLQIKLLTLATSYQLTFLIFSEF